MFGEFDSGLVEMTKILNTPEVYKAEVYKIGGGTIGEHYTNEHWAVRLIDNDGDILLETTELFVGGASNHSEAIDAAIQFLPED